MFEILLPQPGPGCIEEGERTYTYTAKRNAVGSGGDSKALNGSGGFREPNGAQEVPVIVPEIGLAIGTANDNTLTPLGQGKTTHLAPGISLPEQLSCSRLLETVKVAVLAACEDEAAIP